jgi:hypothetical protein
LASAKTVSATLKSPCVGQWKPVASPVRGSSCTADLQIGQRRGLGNGLLRRRRTNAAYLGTTTFWKNSRASITAPKLYQHNGPDHLTKVGSAVSIVSSGFVSRGWALIQSIASCSEVNFPKWCTDRLAHTIFTRQILPSCTGDNRALIDASMIRPVRSYKPYACPFSGRNA